MPVLQILLSLFGLSAGVISASTVMTAVTDGAVSITLAPPPHVVVRDHSFTTTINVRSTEQANVFTGEIDYDPHRLRIEHLTYKATPHDIWTNLPWYQHGTGTIAFTGGTTNPNGFTGQNKPLRITFTATTAGPTTISLKHLRVMQFTPVNQAILDAVATSSEHDFIQQTVAIPVPSKQSLVVLAPGQHEHDQPYRIDLQTFLTDIATQNKRSDLNGDGAVSFADLQLLLAR